MGFFNYIILSFFKIHSEYVFNQIYALQKCSHSLWIIFSSYQWPLKDVVTKYKILGWHFKKKKKKHIAPFSLYLHFFLTRNLLSFLSLLPWTSVFHLCVCYSVYLRHFLFLTGFENSDYNMSCFPYLPIKCLFFA